MRYVTHVKHVCGGGSIHGAIAREKQIKGLLRAKKIALIVSINPEWKDLSEAWFVRHQYQPESA
jgi:predicted GIY-YIG superfamily endonuclease